MLYNNEDRRNAMIKKAISMRISAQKINAIKGVIKNFDGKVYNCKLDKAVTALSDTEYRILAYKNSYGYLEIYGYVKDDGYSEKVDFLYTCVDRESEYFTDKKRIKADGFIEALNNKYSELMKEAARLEDTAGNLENILAQVDQLKKALGGIINNLPYYAIDVCGLKRY